MKKILTLFTLLILTFSCHQNPPSVALEKKVLEIHDEVMPKMGEVMALRKKVLAKADSVENTEALMDLADRLENAQEGMMLWMNEWHENSESQLAEGTTEKEKILFLESEKKKVTKVKDDINSSIAEAQEILENQ